MRLLVIRGDLQSHSGYSAAARDYCRLLRGLFDRILGVDIHFSDERPFEPFPYDLVSDDEARQIARAATTTVALSFTTPDHYTRYDHAANIGLTFWETDRLPLQGCERSPWVACANRMDVIWAPSSHTKTTFERAGVTTPVRVIPWPVRAPGPAPVGLPGGTVYDLNRQPFFAGTLDAAARLPGNRYDWSRRLMQAVRPRAAAALLRRLRSTPAAIVAPAERAILCVAQDVPRKALLLFLSEWMEFQRRYRGGPWTLVLKTSSIDPRTPEFDFVTRFWGHVQALKRQLRVHRSGVYLWTGDLGGPDYERLFANIFACVVPSLGEGFCGPAATALALGKPLVVPRHTALADTVAPGHRYAYATAPALLSFVGDPLRVYDPAASWGVPEPFALADALSRLAEDGPAVRAAVVRTAREHLGAWCGPARVFQMLQDEVERLTNTARRAA